MKNLSWIFILILIPFLACQNSNEVSKIKVYGWLGGPGDATDTELKEQFSDLKDRGIDGLMYNGGQDPATYQRVGKIVKEVGMEFHAWIPTMVQPLKPGLDSAWYGVNGKGESALIKPAYVDYYKFLCPNYEGVFNYLSEMYIEVAKVEEIDGVHLDYIRFPDVILARGLWDKYGLVMDREYPEYDYCYCEKCVSDFKSQSGIDITIVEDPSQNQQWKQFRYDLITKMVNRIVEQVKPTGKVTTAAVFPGPNSIAKKIVRQEWNKWNLDAFYPMNYNDFYLEGPEWVGEVTKEGVEALNDRVPLYSGLFICPDPAKKKQEPDPENHGLLPEEIETAIRVSMENGATGICLFTPGRMTDAHWEVFDKAIHQEYVAK